MGLEPYLLAQYSEVNQDEMAEDDPEEFGYAL
jgi:hypothetical protein